MSAPQPPRKSYWAVKVNFKYPKSLAVVPETQDVGFPDLSSSEDEAIMPENQEKQVNRDTVAIDDDSSEDDDLSSLDSSRCLVEVVSNACKSRQKAKVPSATNFTKEQLREKMATLVDRSNVAEERNSSYVKQLSAVNKKLIVKDIQLNQLNVRIAQLQAKVTKLEINCNSAKFSMNNLIIRPSYLDPLSSGKPFSGLVDTTSYVHTNRSTIYIVIAGGGAVSGW